MCFKFTTKAIISSGIYKSIDQKNVWFNNLFITVKRLRLKSENTDDKFVLKDSFWKYLEHRLSLFQV